MTEIGVRSLRCVRYESYLGTVCFVDSVQHAVDRIGQVLEFAMGFVTPTAFVQLGCVDIANGAMPTLSAESFHPWKNLSVMHC
jgi:hypothetical protein